MGNLDGCGGFYQPRPLCHTSRRELFYQTPQLHRILRDGIFELNFHLLMDGSVSPALGYIVACTVIVFQIAILVSTCP